MHYQMVVGGRTGPQTRIEIVDAIKAFYTIYGVEPQAMTIMAENVETFLKFFNDEEDYARNSLAKSRTIQVFGIAVTVGPQYTLSA
jgi:hypothetical protein